MAIPKPVAIARGILTNIIALISPRLFIRMTAETGRGEICEDADFLEQYSRKVFEDYLGLLQALHLDADEIFKDKVIVEYGPGDFLGVALFFICHGAKRVYCVDRFPLKDDSRYIHIYTKMIKTYSSRLGPVETWSQILGERIIYITEKDGVSTLPEQADLIVSRAVLEHCNNLDKTFHNMDESLKPAGLILHKVDLTSHGTHIDEPMDFLSYSPLTWSLMTSHKGYPNRWRINKYKELLKYFHFKILYEEFQYDYSVEEVKNLRPALASCFRGLTDEELRCSDYFFVAEKNTGTISGIFSP